MKTPEQIRESQLAREETWKKGAEESRPRTAEEQARISAILKSHGDWLRARGIIK